MKKEKPEAPSNVVSFDETRRHYIAGDIILAEIERNPKSAFAKHVRALLAAQGVELPE